MSEYDFKGLKDSIHELIRQIREMTSTITRPLGNLDKLPDFTETILKQLESGFSDVQTNDVILKITEIRAKIETRKQLLENEKKILEKTQETFQKDLDSIYKRYAEIQNELSNEAKVRVEQLDLPVLNLLNKDLKNMVSVYNEISSYTNELILNHQKSIGDKRDALFLIDDEKIKYLVDAIFESHKIINQRIDNYLFDSKDEEIKDYYINTIAYEFQNNDQEKYHMLYIDPRINNKDVINKPNNKLNNIYNLFESGKALESLVKYKVDKNEFRNILKNEIKKYTEYSDSVIEETINYILEDLK